MKMYELERKTGLDRATIRYYEKEGLIHPKRQENGYRDYSDEDMNDLMKIKLLRQLGMSLERICKLQQGSMDFSAALSDQLRILNLKMESARRARDVCQQMLNDRVSYATLDTAVYFERLASAASANTPSIPRTYHEPAAEEPYHPVRRFLARMIDYFLLEFVLLFIATVILRIRPIDSFVLKLIPYSVPYLAVPVFALLLSRIGTTPGKWLMGLAVHGDHCGRLSYADALDREWCVLWYGYGFAVPVVSLYRLWKSYKWYADHPMDWDYRSDYIYHPWKFGRKIAILGVSIVIIFLMIVYFNDSLKPHYRGDLTISEFASNYNDYLETYTDNPSSDAYLQDNGTWGEESGNVNIVVVGTQSENRDFTYETVGETITCIRYENTWTDVFYCDPLSGKAEIAAVTMLMSQNHTAYQDMNQFSELWSSIEGKESGSITCENIEICWEIKSANCTKTTDGWYVTENQDAESTVSLYFEIIVH